MTPVISIVIPTHNPRGDYLQRVLEALRVQTLPREQWEMIVVDNGSREPLKAGAVKSGKVETLEGYDAENCIDLSWHPNARIVREEKLGLTFARLRGFAEARGELILMVDDDNVIAPDYLETAVRIAEERPGLGAFGGKCLPEFEAKPDPWLASVRSGLGLRDLGEVPQLFPEETCGGPRDKETKSRSEAETARGTAEGKLKDEEPSGARQREAPLRASRRLNTEDCKLRLTEFPDCAPVGAGMVLRREAAAAYAERIAQRACGMRRKAGGEEGVSVGQCCGRAVGKTELQKDRITEPRLGETALRQPPNHRAASVITDRKGDSLASGGDNDICLTVVEEGWQVGYLPELMLTHLIPKKRMTLDYHKRMARDSMKSFILMLDQHGIRPWPAMPKWTLPLRVAIDWWRVKPWRGPDESLRFWGNTGMYEGRAALPQQGTRH